MEKGFASVSVACVAEPIVTSIRSGNRTVGSSGVFFIDATDSFDPDDPDNVELFKCYASKSMMKRSAEFPVDVESEKNLESLLEWCKEGPKTIFYRIKNDGSSSEDEQLQESSFSK